MLVETALGAVRLVALASQGAFVVSRDLVRCSSVPLVLLVSSHHLLMLLVLVVLLQMAGVLLIVRQHHVAAAPLRRRLSPLLVVTRDHWLLELVATLMLATSLFLVVVLVIGERVLDASLGLTTNSTATASDVAVVFPGVLLMFLNKSHE